MKTFYFLLSLFVVFVVAGCTTEQNSNFGIANYKSVDYAPTGISTRTISPSVELKFDSLTHINGITTAKVFARSSQQDAEIFGINFRFFWDATDFSKLVTFTNFAGGYGIQGTLNANQGNANSKNLLGTDGPLVYCNTAIQLNSASFPPVALDTLTWNRLFDIKFIDQQQDVSCAPLVWDKMPDPANGGMICCGAGVVVTIVSDRSGIIYTAPTIATGINSNWEFKLPVVKGKYPYGKIVCE